MRPLLAPILIACLCTPPISRAAEIPAPPSDVRIAIKVTSQERNQVLYEMRAFLQGMHFIHTALARNDMKAVAAAARPLGPVLNRFPNGLRERLPETFQELAIANRELFDLIARDAETTGDPRHTLEQLAEAMAYCSGCHDTYRFQVVGKLK